MQDNTYKPAFVKDLFNRMSRTYERMNYITSFGFSIRWRRQFVKHLRATAPKVEIIDLLTAWVKLGMQQSVSFQIQHLLFLTFQKVC
jgi:hypothetical protein